MIKHFLACVVTLSAVVTGCGGVEAEPEPSSTHHEEALPTCASVDGHGCSPYNNPEKFCVYSDGVTGECWCQEPINRWGCARVTE
ncbi:hypothetical protein CYFUS_002405 [Cystobacter fuscus]|uniref:Lipoprotein n=1 Tax=Cystobacter fuscus TaxID=43 RepID=A0A250J0D6_9BACT|nr:hypothetical protein CYFUS_002405 [Cystobacter fuscus]